MHSCTVYCFLDSKIAFYRVVHYTGYIKFYMCSRLMFDTPDFPKRRLFNTPDFSKKTKFDTPDVSKRRMLNIPDFSKCWKRIFYTSDFCFP